MGIKFREVEIGRLLMLSWIVLVCFLWVIQRQSNGNLANFQMLGSTFLQQVFWLFVGWKGLKSKSLIGCKGWQLRTRVLHIHLSRSCFFPSKAELLEDCVRKGEIFAHFEIPNQTFLMTCLVCRKWT